MQLARVSIVLALIFSGCQDRPKAPALRDDPVFEDSQSGLRFLAPTGWTETARSAFPKGPADKDTLLVRYQSAQADKFAVFEVSFVDAPESADIAAMAAAPSHGVHSWSPAGAPEALTVRDAKATRYRLTQKKMTKESIVFRRGGRLYFFTFVYLTTEGAVRDRIQDVVESVVWSK
jgi:hypothetical protein